MSDSTPRCSGSIATKYGLMLCPESSVGTVALASTTFDSEGKHPMHFPMCDAHFKLVTAMEKA